MTLPQLPQLLISLIVSALPFRIAFQHYRNITANITAKGGEEEKEEVF